MKSNDHRKIAAFYDRLEQQEAPEERDTGTVVSAGRLAGRVLDVGCGTGALVAEVRRLAPSARAFGVDISPANARSTLARGIAAGVSSAECLPFPDGCFDVVFFMEVYEHLARGEAILGTLLQAAPDQPLQGWGHSLPAGREPRRQVRRPHHGQP